MKSNEQILKEVFSDYKYPTDNILTPVIKKRVLTAMNNCAIQQEEIVSDIMLKSVLILKPLQDLWRKENSPDKFMIPDAKVFYKWIVKKILK